MHLIGCDFHTRFQQIAMVDSVTGKILNRRLGHGTGEAQQFYVALPAPARIGTLLSDTGIAISPMPDMPFWPIVMYQGINPRIVLSTSANCRDATCGRVTSWGSVAISCRFPATINEANYEGV